MLFGFSLFLAPFQTELFAPPTQRGRGETEEQGFGLARPDAASASRAGAHLPSPAARSSVVSTKIPAWAVAALMETVLIFSCLGCE